MNPTLPPGVPSPGSAAVAGTSGTKKRARRQPRHNIGLENSGELNASPVAGTFTPGIISINAGGDIAMEIMLLSVQRLHAVSVLSATGTLSSVTLRNSASGGTVTHEGDFSILTLSGTLEPGSGEPHMRMGFLNILLAKPDGSVFSGVVAGKLIAATPVQVVVGTFVR